MPTSTVSAVLFAKDSRKVALFYREVFSASVLHTDADHSLLDCRGFQLVVFQIPRHIAQSVVVPVPPQRRENGALRLNFPVEDIGKSRIEAKRLGGQIDDRPPPWAGPDTSFYLGHDSEGNVFGAMPANESLEQAREP